MESYKAPFHVAAGQDTSQEVEVEAVLWWQLCLWRTCQPHIVQSDGKAFSFCPLLIFCSTLWSDPPFEGQRDCWSVSQLLEATQDSECLQQIMRISALKFRHTKLPYSISFICHQADTQCLKCLTLRIMFCDLSKSFLPLKHIRDPSAEQQHLDKKSNFTNHSVCRQSANVSREKYEKIMCGFVVLIGRWKMTRQTEKKQDQLESESHM